MPEIPNTRHGGQRQKQSARGRASRARIRGFAAQDRERDITARMETARVFTAGDPTTALRAARRAAWKGGAGYDPVRHAALCRLARADKST